MALSKANVLSTLAGPLKSKTGLTGVTVSENPHHVLKIVYGKTLRTLNKMPDESIYKKRAEEVVMVRLRAVEEEPNIRKLEDRIDAGIIEQVIIQARNELTLARKMVDWKPWENLVEKPVADQWKWPL